MSAGACDDEADRDDTHYVWCVSASVARRTIQTILRRSQTGPVLVTRQGKPEVVVLGVELYRSLVKALQSAREPAQE